jgi:hypothetical protein
MTPETFAEQFNSRTLAFLPTFKDDGRPVVVAIGQQAHTTPGHLLATALVNQLARAHRTVRIVGELERELLCPSPFGRTTLGEATVQLAQEINPLIDASHAASIDDDALISIGIGTGAELEVGADGWCALFGPHAPITDQHQTLMGAALASILAAATAFHRLRGISGAPAGSYSLWLSGAAGDIQGPLIEQIDVGRVLQTGAGASGCALDYWLTSFGFDGDWLILDGDDVDASNLNRQLLFLARDAGYQDGAAANKAEAAAARCGMRGLPYYYGDERADEALKMFDLILPLANEYGVRAALQSRPQPLLLHATTSPWWSAQLHRHVAGLDDCIVCRLPEEEDPAFDCTTGDVSIDGKQRMDASLPFLAAASGLLLLAALARLQTGQLDEQEANQVTLHLDQPEPAVVETIWECRPTCRVRPAAARRHARAEGTRWAHLDRD